MSSVQNLSLENRLTKAVVTLMRDERFIAMSGIFMIGTRTIKDGNGTASTNGKSEVYYTGFCNPLTQRQLLFLVAHENFHKMLMHGKQWRKFKPQYPKIANMAADFVINGMLENMAGSKSPNPIMDFIPGGCLDHKYDGMDWVAVYKDLVSNAQKNPNSGSGAGQPYDEHNFDDDEEDALTEEELEQVAEQVDAALRQGAIAAGKMGGGLDRSISGLLDVRVPWEELLREFITTHAAGRDYSTWRKLNRRWLGRGMNMPSTQTDATKRIVFAIDTSGSIGQDDLRRFLTEAKGAIDTCMPEIIDLIYWDHVVAGHETYEGEAVSLFHESTKPRGGGGTTPSCVPAYLNKEQIKPDCVIVFTDGYVGGDWGTDWPAPVLWGITTKGVTAGNGQSVYVDL